MRELMVRDAIREALDEEMARDNTVFQMGEDIGVIGGNFKCTVGLRDKYGDLRVKDTPISEQGFVGMGVGAALTGLRPVVELMFADFMMVCGDQLFNQMAKITYMSGGQCNVPMVVRLPLGGGRSSAAQHSQSIHAWAAHIPGVKVVVPSTAGECKGLLKTAIRDNDPVMFFEHKMLYTTKFNDVPEWAQVAVGVCTSMGTMAGYGDGLFGPSDPVSPQMACTVMLRYLEQDGWTYDTACEKAAELGLAPAGSLEGDAITRGDMAILLTGSLDYLAYLQTL